MRAQPRIQPTPLRWRFTARLMPALDSCATTRSSEVRESRFAALFLSQESTKSTWFVSRLFKDYFSHELRAEDIPNLRPIYIALHALLVVYTSSLTERFIGFLLIFLK